MLVRTASGFAQLLLIPVLFVSMTACTKTKPESTANGGAEILSDRPIGSTSDVFVVTLKNPALLTTAKRNGGRLEISAIDKAVVLAEQSAFLVKLKSVAPKANVIFYYRFTLNGLAILAEAGEVPGIEKLPGVMKVSLAKNMARPQALQPVVDGVNAAAAVNSSNFIGAEEAYKQGITGRGVRVGVIDTGVDYTHAMLGGSGSPDEYKAINPLLPSSLFPNAKVVGGIDLAGSEFDAGNPIDAKRVPQPDANPIDEAGHGTHVAGTIAGRGDGINSYDGVAKDADIYAIKVFGKGGSTMDAVVIAGFEYAVDPNGDFNIDDRLDVVNLSLGGGFGQPQLLYTEAVRNLSSAGIMMVASAGNSGPIDYVVGAPGTSDDALSVAATIDGSDHNWKFAAVRFISPNNPSWLAKATEGPISKSIQTINPTEGELVDLGFADTDLTPDMAQKLAGKVALIQRGKVAFADKLKRAEGGGAIGAVVYNNEAGDPIPMGGDGTVGIPAIMVSQALGMKLVEEMKLGAVRIQFKTGELIEEPQLIDQITSFSSKGPRSEDNLIKPEIAAPGQNIISAGMGQGAGTEKLDGTSMASPHMAGVIALLRQAHPELSTTELKSLTMNTAKILTNTSGAPYPISMQGAGRVQIADALASPIVIEPAGISLGLIALNSSRTESRSLAIRNFTAQPVELQISTEASPELSIQVAGTVSIPAGGTVNLPVSTVISLVNMTTFTAELNGRIFFKLGDRVVAQVPMLAVRTMASQIRTTVAAVTGPIPMLNNSVIDGMALAFNLLGEDARKDVLSPTQTWKNRSCDLQSVGYRTLRKPTPQGTKEFLQMAFKIHQPVTTWHLCEVSVLIDGDGDGVADQEMAGIAGDPALKAGGFATVLLDANKARNIRLQYEKDLAAGNATGPDYSPSLLANGSIAPFNLSTIVVIEAPVEPLAKTAAGKLNVKAAALARGGDTSEADDFLGDDLGQWSEIELTPEAQPFFGMNEFDAISGTNQTLSIIRSGTPGKLILYYPMNAFNPVQDNQSQVLN